jgi:hypothetical protein
MIKFCLTAADLQAATEVRQSLKNLLHVFFKTVSKAHLLQTPPNGSPFSPVFSALLHIAMNAFLFSEIYVGFHFQIVLWEYIV